MGRKKQKESKSHPESYQQTWINSYLSKKATPKTLENNQRVDYYEQLN